MSLFNIKRILFFLTFIPITTLADDGQSISALANHTYSIGLDVGGVQPTTIGNATSFPVGYSTFSYSPNDDTVRASIVGISVSKILAIDTLNTLQVGVSVHYVSDMDVNGVLEQGISPSYYQATYSYSISSYQYLAEAKLRHQFFTHIFPYIYLGLGVASNKAYDYSTTVPGYLTVTPDYGDDITNSFTYSLGLGVDYFVKSKLSIGLGYRFIDLGKVGLGEGTIRNTHVGAMLTQSNLYMNILLAQINYFI